jgi:hypothetical protein
MPRRVWTPIMRPDLATTAIPSFHAERVKRFRRHVIDLRDYLLNNQKNLTNYGKARRDGLRISSAPAESGMNHLINQRMGKRQPMRWSANGAHRLLQVRCAVLDHRLDGTLSGMVPSFPVDPADHVCPSSIGALPPTSFHVRSLRSLQKIEPVVHHLSAEPNPEVPKRPLKTPRYGRLKFSPTAIN